MIDVCKWRINGQVNATARTPYVNAAAITGRAETALPWDGILMLSLPEA
jgi:hypothetical protein